MNELSTPAADPVASDQLNGAAPPAGVAKPTADKPKRKRKAKARARKTDPILAASKAIATHTPSALDQGGSTFGENLAAAQPAARPQPAPAAEYDRGARYHAAVFQHDPRPRPDLAPPKRSTWWQRFVAPFQAFNASITEHPDGVLDLRPASILTRGEWLLIQAAPILCLALGAWAAFYWW